LLFYNKTAVLPRYLISSRESHQNLSKEGMREIAFMLAKELSNVLKRELKKREN